MRTRRLAAALIALPVLTLPIVANADIPPLVYTAHITTPQAQQEPKKPLINDLPQPPVLTLPEHLSTATPPTQGILTTGYTMRWGSFHKGIDIANTMGTPIYSVLDGVVTAAGPASGFGQWVKVRHSDSVTAIYGHVETMQVHVGERVAAGQQIATMGSRGFSTGPHLHFQLERPDGSTLDPLVWLGGVGIHEYGG